ncbi:hypothetical protein N9Y91_06905 [Alphaproteobacteria bacterium]|nr:hypothetical protein [Alphaproteobacteria bacterium]
MALIRLNNQSLTNVSALPAGVGGKVLQVVQTSIDSVVSAAAAGENTFNDIAGMSVSITPSATNNKILVSYTINLGNSTGQQNNSIRLMRDTTAIIGTGAAYSNITGFARLYSTPEISPDTLQYLDTPSTTSAITYKLQWATGSGTSYLNRRGNDSNFVTLSTITVMEIAG